jgi:serine/threonine protein kinase
MTNSMPKSEEHITPNFGDLFFRPSARYKIVKDLGEGGIGRVYQAYDLWKRKDIALKILTADKENRFHWESFKNEFLLLTHLCHPGVVEVFDFGYLKPTRCGKSQDDTTHLDPIPGEVP